MSRNACELYICFILLSHGCAICLVATVQISLSIVRFSFGASVFFRNKSTTRQLSYGCHQFLHFRLSILSAVRSLLASCMLTSRANGTHL
jgi:hypothetical protein